MSLRRIRASVVRWFLEPRSHTGRTTGTGVAVNVTFACVAALLPTAGFANTITVNSNLDVVANGDGQCTLREAIVAANDNVASGPVLGECSAGDPAPTRDEIHFDVPMAGVVTIQPTTNLPSATEAVFIDGTTQTGASPNTLEVGSDAVLLIEIDGTNAGAGGVGLSFSSGATNSEVRGLVVNRFASIGLFSEAGDTVFAGNHVGTDSAGAVGLGGPGLGIYVRGATPLVGGPSAADRNVVGPFGIGVRVDGPGQASTAEVRNNYVGVNAAGSASFGTSGGTGVWVNTNAVTVISNVVGNHKVGVDVTRGMDSQILFNKLGTDATSMAPIGNGRGIIIQSTEQTSPSNSLVSSNTIAWNDVHGIEVITHPDNPSPPRGHRLLLNSIHSNGGLGIDLEDDGVDGIDPGDGDDGPNGHQNAPTLLAATSDGTQLTVSWSAASSPNSDYLLELSGSAECDASGFGEGEVPYLETVAFSTDGAGNAAGSSTIAIAIATSVVAATLTDVANHETSEFSNCIEIGSSPVLEVPMSGPASRLFLGALLAMVALLVLRRNVLG